MRRPLFVVATLALTMLAIATGGYHAPSNTALIGPVGDSIVYEAWPELVWHPDSNAGAGDSLLYEFHLATDETFSNCVSSGRLGDTTMKMLDHLLPGREFTWRVLTLDTTGEETESALETFRTYLPGDINANRTVTSVDIIALVHYVFKGGALNVPECAGDVDTDWFGGDHVVNSTDVLTLVNYIFKSGYAPKAKCYGDWGPHDKLMPLHGDLRIWVYEPHRTNPPGDTVNLQLVFETTAHYINHPNSILFDFDSTAQSFHYRLHGVLEASGTVFTWAAPGFHFGDFTLDTGVYDISVERCAWVDRLQLTLTDTYLRLSHLDSQFTELLGPLQWRRPYNSMCVSCYMPAGVEWVCGAFLDSLHAKLELDHFQFPDSGRVPYGFYDDPAFLTYGHESVYDSVLVVFNGFVYGILAGMSEYRDMYIHMANWDGRQESLPYIP